MMMGNGGGGGDGGENSGATLECDVGLGLKMRSSSSTNHESFLPPLTNKMPYHPYNHHSFMDMGGGGGGGGGGSDSGGYGYSSGCGSHVSGVYYDSVAAAPPPPSPLPTTNLLHSSSSSSGGGGGMAGCSGKGVFTANQWQELERQTNIYKYIMAKIPLPPNLLRISSTPLLPTSKSNIGGGGGGLDLRFSSGYDPEPWRCRRTDGKKWRCSRDVTPDHKYCDRHAHKNRPRSRKPVEQQLLTNSHTTTAGNLKNNYTHHPSILSPTTFHNPLSQLPNMVSATTPHEFDQPRWFNKSGGSGTTSTNQQFRQVMQSSPGGLGIEIGIGSKRDRNVSVFKQNYEPDSAGSAATRQQQHLTGNINGNECLLSLSMQSGGNIGIDQEDDQNYPMGMIDQERGGHTHTPWMGSSGGPLGEALCRGIASRRGSSNSSSPCEDGLNFI